MVVSGWGFSGALWETSGNVSCGGGEMSSRFFPMLLLHMAAFVPVIWKRVIWKRVFSVRDIHLDSFKLLKLKTTLHSGGEQRMNAESPSTLNEPLNPEQRHGQELDLSAILSKTSWVCVYICVFAMWHSLETSWR